MNALAIDGGVPRRRFLTGAIVSTVAVGVLTGAEEASAHELQIASGEDVQVTVKIQWANSGKPVVGANIFNHQTNVLLAKTGKSGAATFTAKDGDILRLVEPKYGKQQALKYVQGNRQFNAKGRVSTLGEMWVLG